MSGSMLAGMAGGKSVTRLQSFQNAFYQLLASGTAVSSFTKFFEISLLPVENKRVISGSLISCFLAYFFD